MSLLGTPDYCARRDWSVLCLLSSLLCVLCASVVPSYAAEPTISNLNLRGLQVGGTTTLVVDGTDLEPAPRLLLPFAAEQTLKPGSTATRATFDVTLSADVIAGYYHLRVLTEGGVSLPVVIGVDRLPQQPLAATVAALPAALHGTVSGSNTVETQFTGKAGQKFFAEVEAQRLGSKLRPVVHLTNAKRLQLAWAWSAPALAGDARLEATLPADGTYTLSVHDLEYAGAAPSFFRLKVGQWAFVDQVFPPVVGRGRTQAVELLGTTPAPRQDVSVPDTVGALPLTLPKDGLWSGPRPFVLVSPTAEVVKQGPDVQTLPEAPVAASGRLTQPYAEDRYRLPVKPGTKLRLEVWAERIGSPLDAALVVRNERGDALVRGEDSPATVDPVLDYTVPDAVTAIVIGVVDSQGRGGPKGIYRLTVDPQRAEGGPGGFQLTTTTQRVSLPPGARVVVPVLAERQGYAGPIELSAAILPAGVRLEGTTIPDGADGTLVTVNRDASASAAAITAWRGRGGPDERDVVVKNHPLERLQPWLATEIALAPTTAATEFLVDWRDLPPDAALLPGTKLNLPVQLTRPAGNTTVRLTLLTSQPPLLVNNQPDPNRALRAEKPVELAANVNTGEVTLLVPAGLTGPVYDVTLQAELVSADKRTVLSTSYAPVRRLPVQPPLIVRLRGPERVPVTLDAKAGATVKIQGQVERLGGLTADVAVAVTGLPAGARADSPTVKTGTTEFTLNIVLPANQPAGEIKGLKLSATAAPNPQQANVRVRSAELELTLVVEAAGK